MAIPQNFVAQNGTGQISSDNLNTLVQTATTVASLRGFVGTGLQQVLLEGFTTPNDGGQGAFYWNSSATSTTNPDDGGITNVVPNGASSGVWTRIAPLNATVIPCSAAGSNAIVLTALSDTPPIGKYVNYQLFSFVAAASSTGNVTVQFGALAALNLYNLSGTQVGAGGITSGQFLIIAYNSALNSNAGGFVIVSSYPTSGRLLNLQVITATGTYTPTAGTNSAVIFCQGSGGGGGGSGSTATAGGAGNTTSIGTLASATGGGGGGANAPATGGVGSLGILNLKGSGTTASADLTTLASAGTNGAPGIFGMGGGAGGGFTAAGSAAGANTGGGGGGGGGNSSITAGSGGAAGGLAIAYATGVTGTYSVTIGAGGAAGTAGSSGSAGGAGGSGVVIVLEFA